MRLGLALVALMLLPSAATAAAPAAVGPAVQISERTYSEFATFVGQDPQVAVGRTTALVVWDAYRETGNRVGHNIYGKLLDAQGRAVGNDFAISADNQGQDKHPVVAYDSRADQYLVAWERGVGPGKQEIYGQRVVPSLGSAAPAAPQDMQLSDGGVVAIGPDVAYSPVSNEYLVVWSDERLGNALSEVWGQRVVGRGHQVGEDVRLTQTTGDQAVRPQVAFNPLTKQWGVFWLDARAGHCLSDGNSCSLRLGIYGRTFSPDLAKASADTSMDDPADPWPALASASGPLEVAVDPEHGVFLVLMATTFDHVRDGPRRPADAYGVFWLPDGRRITTPISDLQSAPRRNFLALSAASLSAAYAPQSDEFLVTWGAASAEQASGEPDRFEIWGQRLGYTPRSDDPCPAGRFPTPCEAATTYEIEDDFRITHGTDAQPDNDALPGPVGYLPAVNRWLSVFGAPPTGFTYAEGKEIWAQILAGPSPRDAPLPPEFARADLTEGVGDLVADKPEGAGLVLSCPAEQTAATCEGELNGQTTKAIAGKKVRLPAVRFSIPRGARRTARLKFPLSVRRELAKAGSLKLALAVKRTGLPTLTRRVTIYASAGTLAISAAGRVRVRVALPGAATSGRAQLRIGSRVAATAPVRVASGRSVVITFTLRPADRDKAIKAKIATVAGSRALLWPVQLRPA